MKEGVLVRSWKSLAVSTALCATVAGAAPATPTFGYAGCLTDPGGNPWPSGNQSMFVSLFDAATGGTALATFDFGNTLPAVSVRAGCFSFQLDLPPALVADGGTDQQLFMEIKINGTPFPRIRFNAVPYALWAGAVHWADVKEKPSLVNSLAVGQGLTASSATGAVQVGVDFNEVQRRVGACPPGRYLQNIDVDGGVTCGVPGAPTVTVGTGLLVGSDGGASGGTGNTTVTGDQLVFALNLAPAGATTAGPAVALTDAGTTPLRTANGSAPALARADHRHGTHVWLPPTAFELTDGTETTTPYTASLVRVTTNTGSFGAFAYKAMLLGGADSATALVPMPMDFVPSRVIVRVYAGCPQTSNFNYQPSSSGSCNTLLAPMIRQAAVNGAGGLSSLILSGGYTPNWGPAEVLLPGLPSSLGRSATVSFVPQRIGFTQCCSGPTPPSPAQLGDLLFLQLLSSVTNMGTGVWEVQGVDLEFIP